MTQELDFLSRAHWGTPLHIDTGEKWLISAFTTTRFMMAPYLKLSRQDSFGTPAGVRLSFLYPSPMRGAARRKK